MENDFENDNVTEEAQTQNPVPQNGKHPFAKGVFAGVVLSVAAAAVMILVMIQTGRLTIDRGEEAQTVSSGEEQFLIKKKLVDSYIQNGFLFDYSQQDLEDMMFRGLAAGLEDPYAAYYSAEEYQSMQETAKGVYYGIGVLAQQDRETKEISIGQVYEGGPAEEAGVLKGDVLLGVAGVDITGMDLSDVVDKIKGESGTTVHLKFRRGEDEILELDVERRDVKTIDVKWEMLEDNIAYVQILKFDSIAKTQFQEALKELQAQGAEKIVFDVRDNPGGGLDVVVDILDRLLPEGLITYMENKQGQRIQEIKSDAEHFVDLPMAVLVNGSSASASEVFTGALKDYGMAEVVGTKTYGKGIVQTIFPLGDGSAIKMTTSRYFTPNGVCIHGTGIEPDVTVELDESLQGKEKISHEEDNQLQKALEILKEK